METNAVKAPRIVQRAIEAAPGANALVKFQATTGLAPRADIYDPNNRQIASGVALTEVGTTGVYEYKWPVGKNAMEGEYTVIIKEPTKGGMDSMSIKVKKAESVLAPADASTAANEANVNAKKTFKEVDGLKTQLTELMDQLKTTITTAEEGSGGGSTTTVINNGSPAVMQNVQQGVTLSREQAEKLAKQNNLSIDELTKMGKEQATHMKTQAEEFKEMKNQILRINAILDAINLTVGSDKPIIKDWMEAGSVIIKAMAINPSKDKAQEVPIKTYLPMEVKPENILNREEVEIGFDTARSLFYAEKKVTLKPGESYTLMVHIEDIWKVPEDELNRLEEQAEGAMKILQGSSSYDVAKLLYQNIKSSLEMIKVRQEDETQSPQEHIANYRLSLKLLEDSRKDLNSLKDFAVVSPGPGEGKTTLASNLAIVLAQANLKVLFVDTDFRRGRVHDIYELMNDKGLGEYLTEGLPLDEVVRKTETPNLSLVTCGKSVIDSAQLLASGRMAEFIKETRKRYDMVIYDTPPVTIISDASIMMSQLDGCLLSIRCGFTSARVMSRALTLIKESKSRLIGVVLNAVTMNDAASYNKYYKKYYNKVSVRRT